MSNDINSYVKHLLIDINNSSSSNEGYGQQFSGYFQLNKCMCLFLMWTNLHLKSSEKLILSYQLKQNNDISTTTTTTATTTNNTNNTIRFITKMIYHSFTSSMKYTIYCFYRFSFKKYLEEQW